MNTDVAKISVPERMIEEIGKIKPRNRKEKAVWS